MFSAISELSAREILPFEAPAFAGSVIIAEAMYKFHSFTLELVAFLITWYALGRAVRAITRLARAARVG